MEFCVYVCVFRMFLINIVFYGQKNIYENKFVIDIFDCLFNIIFFYLQLLKF